MTFINALIAGILLVCSGGGFVAIFNAIVGRKGRRADLAQSVTDVATSVNQLNQELRKEIRDLKEAVIELTDVVDLLRPEMKLTAKQNEMLRLATNKAKLAC